jgi:hypothetical protein
MYAGLTLVTPPTIEPVSVADAKKHSRIFINEDDALIAGYIQVARLRAENITHRAFLKQQWRFALQTWPGRTIALGYREGGPDFYWRNNYFSLPRPPLISVDEFVYYDTTNTQYSMTPGYSNTVGNYFVDFDHEPMRIALPFAGIWPTTVLLPQSPIRLTLTAGYPQFAGLVNVTRSGLVTSAASPPVALFDPSLVGTWVTINNVSYNCQSVSVDLFSMQLSTPAQAPLDNVPFTGNAVPMAIRIGILFLAAHAYENREPVMTGRGLVSIEIPGTADTLLSDYRIFEPLNILAGGDN